MPDIWFGGMIVNFSGDFYQHPPVSETALYQPISNSMRQDNNEIKKRLGRLAWKSVDTVIELNEQKRMENDLEYANAVNRLQNCKCNFDDEIYLIPELSQVLQTQMVLIWECLIILMQ